MTLAEVERDITTIPVDAIVNPWNRNFVPRWLLTPSGVSGALRQKTGPEPWNELARSGVLRLGQAVTTSAGHLATARALIHVAGLTILWRATIASVRLSTAHAVDEAVAHGFRTLAIPLIGAGHGGLSDTVSRATILKSLDQTAPLHVIVVHHPRTTTSRTP